MKLDVDVLRYLSKEDFRVLTAVEMGMRNVSLFLSQLFTSTPTTTCFQFHSLITHFPRICNFQFLSVFNFIYFFSLSKHWLFLFLILSLHVLPSAWNCTFGAHPPHCVSQVCLSLSLSYSPRKSLKIYDLNYISIDIYMVLIMLRYYVTKFCHIPIMTTACFLYELSPCVFVKAWRYLQGAEELAQAQTVASWLFQMWVIVSS